MNLRQLLLLKAAGGIGKEVEAEATGNPVTFLTDLAKPLKKLLLSWTPTQSGSGDPSPENVRPISGRTGVTVWHTGKNLLNPVWWDDVAENKSYVRYEDGTLVYQSNTYKTSDYVSVMGNTKYTLHAVMYGQQSGGIAFYDSSKQYISGTQINNSTKTDHTFTTPSNAVYMRFGDSNDKMPWNEVMLVYGSTAPTAYEPYSGTSYPVTFPALGKNLFDYTALILGTLDGNGKYSPSDTKNVTDYIFIPAGTYTVSRVRQVMTYWKAYSYNMDKEKLSRLWDGTAKTYTITFEYDVYVRIAFDYIVDEPEEVQLESGSTATTYEPYTNTIYGGTLDLVSGVLTKTWVLRPMKSMRWGNFSGFYIFVAQEQKDKITMPLCDCYPVVTGNPSNDQTVGAYANGASYAGSILFNKSGMSSVQDFTDWLNGLDYDPYIAYHLPEPVTYQLTPQQVTTALIGNNTIWSNANGNCEVTYLKKG